MKYYRFKDYTEEEYTIEELEKLLGHKIKIKGENK